MDDDFDLFVSMATDEAARKDDDDFDLLLSMAAEDPYAESLNHPAVGRNETTKKVPVGATSVKPTAPQRKGELMELDDLGEGGNDLVPKPRRAFKTSAPAPRTTKLIVPPVEKKAFERLGDKQKLEESKPAYTTLPKGEAVEKFSGLRLKNRLVPSLVIEERLKEAKFFAVDRLRSANPDNLPESWSTIAVVAQRNRPKESKGGKYAMWRLSDLEGAEIALFLFGDAYKHHWKEEEGAVVGLRGAKGRKSEGNYESGVTFNIERPEQMYRIGTAQDFGICKAEKKDGRPCTMAINKARSEYCHYHVAAAFKSIAGSRLELGGGAVAKHMQKQAEAKEKANGIHAFAARPVAKTISSGQMKAHAEAGLGLKAHSAGSRQLQGAAAVHGMVEKRTLHDKKERPKSASEARVQRHRDEPLANLNNETKNQLNTLAQRATGNGTSSRFGPHANSTLGRPAGAAQGASRYQAQGQRVLDDSDEAEKKRRALEAFRTRDQAPAGPRPAQQPLRAAVPAQKHNALLEKCGLTPRAEASSARGVPQRAQGGAGGAPQRPLAGQGPPQRSQGDPREPGVAQQRSQAVHNSIRAPKPSREGPEQRPGPPATKIGGPVSMKGPPGALRPTVELDEDDLLGAPEPLASCPPRSSTSAPPDRIRVSPPAPPKGPARSAAPTQGPSSGPAVQAAGQSAGSQRSAAREGPRDAAAAGHEAGAVPVTKIAAAEEGSGPRAGAAAAPAEDIELPCSPIHSFPDPAVPVTKIAAAEERSGPRASAVAAPAEDIELPCSPIRSFPDPGQDGPRGTDDDHSDQGHDDSAADSDEEEIAQLRAAQIEAKLKAAQLEAELREAKLRAAEAKAKKRAAGKEAGSKRPRDEKENVLNESEPAARPATRDDRHRSGHPSDPSQHRARPEGDRHIRGPPGGAPLGDRSHKHGDEPRPSDRRPDGHRSEARRHSDGITRRPLLSDQYLRKEAGGPGGAAASNVVQPSAKLLARGVELGVLPRAAAAGAAADPAVGEKRAHTSAFAAAFGSALANTDTLGSKSKYWREAEEEYDDAALARLGMLEKKDEMAQQIDGVTKLKVKAYVCSCGEIGEKPKSSCREQGHAYQKKDVTKRFFKCKHCSKRTFSLNAHMPKHACRCGESDFVKCGMARTADKTYADEHIASRANMKARGQEYGFSLKQD